MQAIGYRTGCIDEPKRSNWQNSGPRPIAWSAWYPAGEDSAQPLPTDLFFAPGEILPGAALAEGGPQHFTLGPFDILTSFPQPGSGHRLPLQCAPA